MRIAYVTAGGAGMFCGSCMRDNTLVAALIRMGTDIVLVPTFTPITTDEEDVSSERVFLGGITVYLEQRWPIFRHLPGWTRRVMDHPRLLRAVSRLALQTRREEDGAVAISLLRGEKGNQADEIRDLVDWLACDLQPDLVNLTNLLIAGFVPMLKRRRDVPVIVTLQGDDIFLDSLLEADREVALGEMRRIAQSIDGFVVFSEFYRDHMAQLLRVSPQRFHLAPMGLDAPAAFARPDGPVVERPPPPPTVGYLARICPEKGFHLVADAVRQLRARAGTEHVRLRAAGWLGARDRPFFEEQSAQLAAAGVDFARIEIPDRASKIRFLHTLDVLSVPAIYREPKGLYVLEALAAGVPVVEPSHGAFPELLATTGGGVLCAPDDSAALTTALHDLLVRPDHARQIGEEGRRHVVAACDSAAMARRTLEIWREFVPG